MLKVKINSLEDLKTFTEKLAECLKGNELILLKGNLASGKTTFTRYLVSSIDKEAEEEVNSPTFTVMNVYETKKFPVYHIDLYRVKDFDFTDILDTGVVIVEWAEEELLNIDNLPVMFIEIEPVGDTERILKIKHKNTDYLINCIGN